MQKFNREIFYVRYSTLLHMPLLRFHCVGGCWYRIQNYCESFCDFGIGSQTLVLLQYCEKLSMLTENLKYHPYIVQLWQIFFAKINVIFMLLNNYNFPFIGYKVETDNTKRPLHYIYLTDNATSLVKLTTTSRQGHFSLPVDNRYIYNTDNADE
jgi:hypothetical protein